MGMVMEKPDKEILISSYLDGELAPSKTRIFAKEIRHNKELKEQTLNVLEAMVLLKALTKEEQREELPAALLDKIKTTRKKRRLWDIKMPRAVAAVLMVSVFLLGIGLGQRSIPDGVETASTNQSSFFQVPAAYDHIVQSALEYNLSGTPKKWMDSDVSLLITPLKSYRDNDGIFYRLYQMEVYSQKQQQTFRCIAFRNKDRKWQTKTISFSERMNEI